MLRTFLKPQNLRAVISLNNYAKACSTSVPQPADPNALKRRANLVTRPDGLTILTRQASVAKSTTDLDKLIKNVNDCKSLSSLFELVKPLLTELTDTHMNVIFNKLNNLFFDGSLFDKERALNAKQSLQGSPVFKSLMERANRLVNELSTSTLLRLLHTFSLAELDPKFVIVKRTLDELNSRLDVMDLDAVIECAKQLHYYLGTRFSEQLFEFNGRVIHILRAHLQTNRIDPRNLKQTVNFWFIFLKPENDPSGEVAEYMARQLLSPDVKLNFRQAVLLMRKIKLNHYLYRERLSKPDYQPMRRMYFRRIELEFKKKSLFPRVLADLVDKCNTAIHETLSLQATDEDFGYFLDNLHDFVHDLSFEFPNFYDPSILPFLVPYLTQNVESNARLKVLVFELVQNYAKFNIYDEKLTKVVYDLCLNDKKPPSGNSSQFYFLLSKYRLPFVDHRHLSRVLFSFSTNHQLTDSKANPLRVLCELILNDVHDENLLGYLNDIVDHQKDEYYASFKSVNQYKQIALARHYLSTKNVLKDGLKAKLQDVLDQVIYNLNAFYKKPMISYKLFHTDRRLQKNGFLSNGIYIETFGIYDSLRAGLVPMTRELIDSFKHRVEQIPRTEGQEL